MQITAAHHLLTVAEDISTGFLSAGICCSLKGTLFIHVISMAGAKKQICCFS